MNKGTITNEGYYLQKSGDRVSTLLSRHYIVPTLSSPPDENTLTWKDDSYTINFRIGEFARVALDGDYLFYRLNDIAENKASWEALTSEDLSTYYTKEEIDALLTNLKPTVPQPDWNAGSDDAGFIANRTHYYDSISYIGQYQLASFNVGDILIADLDDEFVYLIQNTEGPVSYYVTELIPTEGNRIALPVNGPTVYAVVVKDEEDKLNLILENNSGISNYIKIQKSHIGKVLCEKFLPEQIARTKDVDAVKNSILGEDGYVYSNGEKVDMRFTRSLLPVGTSIPANSNLNTINYLKIGKYYCSLNVDAETITNCPVKVAFSMEVFNPLGTNVDDETTKQYTYRLRVLTQYDSGTQYMQFCKTSGTAGSWTYGDWYAAPRTKATLNSNKKGSTLALGSATQGVYVASTGVLTKMTYTLSKSVPSNAVFTDTNTKVTAVGNHYTPTEDADCQMDAAEGEMITGLKMDAAGHIVGISTAVAGTGGGEVAASNIYITDFTAETLFSTIDFALANPGQYKSFDASAELLNAIREGKIILIPYDNTMSGSGYVCAIEALNDGDTDSFLTIIREDSLIRICLLNEDLEHDFIYISDSKLSIKKIGEGRPEVYITDFSMDDIEMAIEGATENPGINFSVDADGAKLWDAIQTRKQIIVPVNGRDDIGGYYTVSEVYHDGMGEIKMSIFTGAGTLYFRIPKDYLLSNNKLNFNSELHNAENVLWWRYYMSNEDLYISTSAYSDSIVKRSPDGDIAAHSMYLNGYLIDTDGHFWATPSSDEALKADADYIFQEQLKSGQNIKTVNNQSLLGSGNINIEGGSASYITPFTVDDLFYAIDNALANPDKYYRFQASPDLITALDEGKTILIPYGQDPGYLSVIRAMNDGETTYLTITRGTTLIKLKLSNDELYHDEIYLTADKISIEKTSVSAEPDTIVKRSDIGGVYATAWHDDASNTWVTPTSSQDAKEGADGVLQEYIADLDAIRSGAALGATAMQSIPSEYATETYVNNAILAAITTTLNTPV